MIPNEEHAPADGTAIGQMEGDQCDEEIQPGLQVGSADCPK